MFCCRRDSIAQRQGGARTLALAFRLGGLLLFIIYLYKL